MKNGYGIGEFLGNIIFFIYTKVFYKQARLIRLPIYVRGKNLLKYGKGFTTGYNCRLEMFDIDNKGNKKIIIGENCKIGDYVHIAAGERVEIGDNVLLASKIFISDLNHGNYSSSNITEDSSPRIPPDLRPLNTKPVVIGKNVWIGENVSILAGVTIGEGSIIGANSVVSKNVPKNSISVGIPNRTIKEYSEDKKAWIKKI